MHRHRRTLRPLCCRAVGALALALGVSLASPAHAGPRDDIKTAYGVAQSQFNELELDAALATLEVAIARAQGAGLAADPMLAPLLVLRGGVVYSNTGDRSRTIAAFQEAVRADYYVVLPIELRSEDLQALLDEARAGTAQPGTGPVAHNPPAAETGADIMFEAQSAVPVTDGATMVLYWRAKGTDGEFEALYLETFGNVGTVTVPAAAHGDAGIEYFFYVYDAQVQPLANLGGKDNPLLLEMVAGGAGGGGDDKGGDDKGDDDKGDDDKKKKKDRPPPGTHVWPRVFINLGVGTGFGLARGTAEQTYQQFTPGNRAFSYGPAEQACAIERWYAGPGTVADNAAEFDQHLRTLQPGVVPGGDIDTLVANYNPSLCSRRHAVTTGFASAPFHVAPEIAVRVLQRDVGTQRTMALVVGAYSRLQVVTGSKVFTENPFLAPEVSFGQEVISPNPTGFQRKAPFTWAVGLKVKALIGKRGGKFQGMVGGFGGYGNARLRVPMGFSNDRNGNSVPDRAETALSGPADPTTNQVPPESCTPVWPYNDGCSNSNEGMTDQGLASAVQTTAQDDPVRVDTVRLGPGFAGVLFGFHYQLHKNFALFAEANVGGWFPDIGSLLIDINAGPSITF